MIVKILWRSRDIEFWYVWTSSDHNCAMEPWCHCLNSLVRPLEFIIIYGFPLIPLNWKSYPSKKKIMISSWKLNSNNTYILREGGHNQYKTTSTNLNLINHTHKIYHFWNIEHKNYVKTSMSCDTNPCRNQPNGNTNPRH